MRGISKVTALGMAFGTVLAMASCGKPGNPSNRDNGGRRVIQKMADPSGKWIVVIDEVEYANGLLTSVADRISLVSTKHPDKEGTLVFSEDAMPDAEKPTVVWESNRLVVSISSSATVLHQSEEADGVRIVVRKK